MYYGMFDPFNFFFHAIGWILVIWLIIWIIRGARRRHHMYHSYWCDGTNCNHPMHGSRALDLLKERFVKGEISKEEFEEKKHALTK